MSSLKDWHGTPIRTGQRVVNSSGETFGVVTEVDESTHLVTVRRLWPRTEMVITEEMFSDGFLKVAIPPADLSYTDAFFDRSLVRPGD
jgi:hypothetical protein